MIGTSSNQSPTLQSTDQDLEGQCLGYVIGHLAIACGDNNCRYIATAEVLKKYIEQKVNIDDGGHEKNCHV